MNKLKILCAVILIIITSGIIVRSNNKTFKKDDVIFAVTLDGNSIDYFPDKGKYNVNVNCKNGVGKWSSKEWKLIVEDISGEIYCNLDFLSNPDSLKNVISVNAQVNINGKRFNGLTPDNYVWFNDELWRIIGDIPVKNENGTIENLVKIVRNDSIGSLYYDTESNVEWGKNTLYTLLNDYYYGKKDASNTSICDRTLAQKCDYSNSGIDPDGYYGKMIKKVYWNTGYVSLINYLDNIYNNEKHIQKTTGYVGLINVSDYGYATTQDYYDLANWNNIYDNMEGISSNNWLHQGSMHTLTRASINENAYLKIYYHGVIGNGILGTASSTRPVVYLDPSVYVVSGTGTEANPYQIAM